MNAFRARHSVTIKSDRLVTVAVLALIRVIDLKCQSSASIRNGRRRTPSAATIIA
jgi:hypothetical protein